MKRSIQLGLLSAVIALSGTLKAADQAAPAPDEAATLADDDTPGVVVMTPDTAPVRVTDACVLTGRM